METVNDTLPPTEPPPPYRQPGNRLTRSTDDKVVSGLSGGLGRWFGIDPIVFRIAFVVLTLAGGSGILLYLIGWLLIPDDTGGAALNRFGNERNSKLVAAVLGGLGVILLLDDIGGDDNIPLGVVLVGLGGLYLWSRRKSDSDGGPPAPPASPSPPSPPTDDIAVTPASPSDAHTVPFSAPATVVDPPLTTAPAREPKPRSALVPVTLSLLAILAGGLALVGVSLTTALALALLLTSGALVFGAWRGRARGLIPIGLLLAMALGAASVIDDVPLRGGTGEVSFRPAALEEIRTPYRLSAGELVVDLSDLDLQGQTVTIVASVAAGNLQVVAPRDVAVDVEAHVGAGDIDAFGRLFEGLDVDRRFTEPGQEGAGRLVLRARVGLGQMEVRRAAA